MELGRVGCTSNGLVVCKRSRDTQLPAAEYGTLREDVQGAATRSSYSRCGATADCARANLSRMGFLSRLLIPRSVRRAGHPGRAVKRAITPRPLSAPAGRQRCAPGPAGPRGHRRVRGPAAQHLPDHGADRGAAGQRPVRCDRHQLVVAGGSPKGWAGAYSTRLHGQWPPADSDGASDPFPVIGASRINVISLKQVTRRRFASAQLVALLVH